MKIRLGYVSISKCLDNVTASSLLTYSHYKKIGEEKGKEKLNKIIISNLLDLEKILIYNSKNNIHFYRLTSSLIPLDGLVDIDLAIYQKYFSNITKIIKENKIRVDMHPNQFCVLNSLNEDVIYSSVKILEYHKKIFDILNIKSLLVLHIGSKALGKKKAIERFISTYQKLDDNIKDLIIIENDDKSFNTYNTLYLCQKINRPMVLDYHHHLINKTSKDINFYLKDILLTWKKHNLIPKMHFSTSKGKNKSQKRSHNDFVNSDDFINFIEILKQYNTDIDIMIEAKEKDIALLRLVNELKYKTNYYFIDETTFII